MASRLDNYLHGIMIPKVRVQVADQFKGHEHDRGGCGQARNRNHHDAEKRRREDQRDAPVGAEHLLFARAADVLALPEEVHVERNRVDSTRMPTLPSALSELRMAAEGSGLMVNSTAPLPAGTSASRVTSAVRG